MNMKFLSSVVIAVLLSAGGAVIAGPEEKGRESVLIRHSNGSDGGDGSVEIDVPVPAAIAHLLKHEGDCVVDASDEALEEIMAQLQSANNCSITE